MSLVTHWVGVVKTNQLLEPVAPEVGDTVNTVFGGYPGSSTRHPMVT